VIEAYGATTKVVHELEKALLCAEHVVWKQKDKRTGKWSEYSPRVSREIEKEYKVKNLPTTMDVGRRSRGPSPLVSKFDIFLLSF